MGDLIEFSKDNDTENEILKIFTRLNDFIIFNKDELKKCDNCSYLIDGFYDAYYNFKTGDWKKYNNNRFLKNFNVITYDNNDFVRFINELLYINFYNLSRYNFSSLKKENMMLIMNIRRKFNYLSNYKSKKLIEIMSNPYSRKKIESLDNELEKEEYLINYINNLKDESDNENNKNYEITFSDIECYYINKANECINYKNINVDEFYDETILNTIFKISVIKKYNNILKYKFILVAQHINYISLNIKEELTDLANLINLFIIYKKKINEMTTTDLINILLIMKKNPEDKIVTAVKKYEKNEMR